MDDTRRVQTPFKSIFNIELFMHTPQINKHEFDKSNSCPSSEYAFGILNWLGNHTIEFNLVKSFLSEQGFTG